MRARSSAFRRASAFVVSTGRASVAGVVALLLVAPPVRAARSWQGAPAKSAILADEPHREARIVVDAAAFGPTAKVLAERVHERVASALAGEVRGEDHYRILVEPLPDGSIGYQVAYERLGGAGQVIVRRASQCRLCTESELLDQVEATVVRLVPETPAAVDGAMAAPDGSAELEAVPPEQPTKRRKRLAERRQADESTTTARLGKLGAAGIGVAVVGLLGVGVGAGLAAREPVYKPRPTYLLRTREPGIAVASIGGAALIAGLTMLAVDVVRRRKSRRAATLRFQPLDVRTAWGWSLGGDF